MSVLCHQGEVRDHKGPFVIGYVTGVRLAGGTYCKNSQKPPKSHPKCLTRSNPARDQFLAFLDSDAEPNEALIAAAERYKEGHQVGDKYYFKA